MGACCCCCKKSKELKELEDELDMIVNQKRLLEMKVYKKNSDTESSCTQNLSENLKFIDYDLYTSLKIIESGFAITSSEFEGHQDLNLKVQSVGDLLGEQKLIKYAEIRCQETEIQKKIMAGLQETLKELSEFVNKKMNSVEERIEKVESLLLNSSHFAEERQELIKKFKNIPSSPKKDLNQVLSILNRLEDLEISLRIIENFLPGLNLDPLFALKLKDIDRTLNNFIKSSVQTFNTVDLMLGQSTFSDTSSLKSLELNFDTYQTLFESLSKELGSLQSLESSKQQIIETQTLTSQIKSIDDLLNSHFTSSEKDKEEACSRLKRLSRSSSDFSYFSSSAIFEIDSSQKSLKQNLEVLEKKVRNYLKINKQQDRLILEMTEKIACFDQVFDEIEIKFQEFVSAEIKDLSKVLVSADLAIKATLEKTNEKLISYSEETQKDFSQRLQSFLEKILLTDDLQKVKNSVRDQQIKELAKVKAEGQEKINEVSNKLDAAENERLLMQNSLNTSKSQLLLITGMKEDLIKSASEKDSLVASLKNNIASLEENLQQNIEEKEKLQEEVEDLQKDLRECKKMLRNKEYEISELKESISKTE